MSAEEKFIHFLHALGQHRGRTAGRHEQLSAHDHHGTNEIFQVSTLNAILQGAYDGVVTYGHLRQHGDFGLGTFNGLDGEMVMVDGQVYQIKVDGSVSPVDDAMQTPFAVVEFFEPTWRRTIDQPLTLAELPELLHSHFASDNYFYAVRLDGHFAHVKARSVARQVKPYPPLVEVTKTQSIFALENVTGSLVGFRFPDYTQGLNMPGLHLHFITDDRQAGGHVLDFQLTQGELTVEHTAAFQLELPETEEFSQAGLDFDNRELVRQAEQ